MFNMKEFLDDYNINYTTQGKNTSEDFMNINCPFCGDRNNHLGLHKYKGYGYCWKCGHKKLYDIIKELTDETNIKKIIEKYSDDNITIDTKVIKPAQHVKLPGGELKTEHKQYLTNRGFNPDYITDKYQIRGTNHIGNFCFRIIIPIIYKGQVVSYQGRTILPNEEIRYKDCKREKEVIFHKNILYNLDNCKNDFIIVTEGVMKVWKIGDNSCATFGKNYSKEQLKILSDYNKIFTWFDPDSYGQDAVNELTSELDSIGKEVINIISDDAPDNLSEKEIKNILKTLKLS